MLSLGQNYALLYLAGPIVLQALGACSNSSPVAIEGDPDASPLQTDAALDGGASRECTDTTVQDGVVLACHQLEPMDLAIDETNVYWTDLLGSLWRVSKNGGTIEILFSATDVRAGRLTNDAENVYWINSFDGRGHVSVFHKTTQKSEVVVSGDWNATNITAKDGFLFVSTNKNGQSAILAINTNDYSQQTIVSAQPLIYSIIVDDAEIYWTSTSSEGVGRLRRINRATGAIETLWVSTTANNFGGMAIDDQHIYWTASSCRHNGECPLHERPTCCQGSLLAMSRTGTIATTLVQSDDWRLLGILLVNHELIYATPTAVWRAGSAIRIASDRAYPLGISTDGAYLFWVERGVLGDLAMYKGNVIKTSL